MTFLWPALLGSWLVVPLLIGLYLRAQRRRQRLAERFAGLGLPAAAGAPAGWRRHLPPAIFLVGLLLLLTALARPQLAVSLPRAEGLVILAFDVSGSMAGDDMQPTRMEAAKTAAQGFVERQPAGVAIGVVAFSDSGLTVQTPTHDRDAILAAIQRLKPERGTSLGSGILASLDVIAAAENPAPPRFYSNRTPEPTPSPTPVPAGTHTSAVIVLLSDGENTAAPDPFTAAQAAADRGVRIHTVGLGSEAGSLLNIEGFTIHSRLDPAALRGIAELTGGAYYGAATEAELQAVYDTIDLRWAVKPEEMEITALLAGASLAVLLIGGALALLWFGRLP
ncbi:MAG: VWA domain-containing protein [Anaerolineales bacterium]|nr:VWA domain-containing protein [Anaerolineales bacterium]